MTTKVKVHRNGTVTIPRAWRSPDFEEGNVVEAERTKEGILLHPAKSAMRPPAKPGGWRAILDSPGIPSDVIDELQRVIEEGCEQIDPEKWK